MLDGKKFDPNTWMVVSPWPAVAPLGDVDTMIGGGASNTTGNGPDSPPPLPGLNTVIWCVPGPTTVAGTDAMSALVAVIVPTKKVGSERPSMRTTECWWKPVPPICSVSVSLETIGGVCEIADVTDGTGLNSSRWTTPDGPTVGAGFVTRMSTRPGFAMIAAGSTALTSVGERNVVASGEIPTTS